MGDSVPEAHRRALSDYKIALGLELRSRRENAGYSFDKLASHSNIPAETLRAYERGASLPQLVRVARIASTFNVGMFDILKSVAEYIYRASGEPVPNSTNATFDRIALRAIILYCGVTPAQLRLIEEYPSRYESLAEDLFTE
ncbi:MAG: helix-turn-helix transcriptional regulator [Pseudonocardiales bacterium]|nr:helix-turn-helix transcriptional regulator [Pseudonocardiales bacterium]